MSETNAGTKDDKCIERAQSRLLRAYTRLGAWRLVGRELGVNHGYLVALVRHGKVPQDPGIRKKVGLPRVLPSERKPRVRRVMPRLGSPCWMCMAFKPIKPKRRKL